MLKGYLKKALEFPKYAKAIRNRELIRMPIYITEKCNSRCKTCHIWRKENPIDMPVRMFKGILDDPVSRKAFIVLQGGEPTMHPQIEEILELLSRRGSNYQLFSNGILAEKLAYLVKEYKVPSVALSCDGTGETYRRIRGVDNYGRIVWLLAELREITHLELSYIISSWNTRGDLLEVARLAKRFGAVLNVDVYDEIEYFGADKPRMKEIYKADDVVPYPKSECLRLYNKWAKGEMLMSCRSIRFSCFITTGGMVYPCGRRLVPLGDLREQSLSEIWNTPSTVDVQDLLGNNCGKCWSTCYRNVDVAFDLLPPILAGRKH